nr:unnamed protein product [Spirometra erinaceieuropaei]
MRDCFYVAHTGRRLGTRINEHKQSVRRLDPLSLVFAHALERDHRFSWDGTEVVTMASTTRTREFLEAWYSNAGGIRRQVDQDAIYMDICSPLTDPCPNRTSTTANPATPSPTDPSSTLPPSHGTKPTMTLRPSPSHANGQSILSRQLIWTLPRCFPHLSKRPREQLTSPSKHCANRRIVDVNVGCTRIRVRICLPPVPGTDHENPTVIQGTHRWQELTPPVHDSSTVESLVFRHHRPKFWPRYVDDTFVVIGRDQVLTFKGQLNAVFPDIQFTMEEEEENNQLAFLDVLVCRKDCGGLKTKVFRKATNTTQILNFNSNHPIGHKRSCVRALYRLVETHCSEMEDKVAELQYLRRVMKANGYPRSFVNQCIRKGHQRPNPTGPKFWRDLPYVKNVSEAVSRLLTPLGVGVAHRPGATIRRQVMRPKDPLPRQDTTGVIYRIRCSCGQSNYVGETGRLLRTRLAEHAAAVRREDVNSQVAAHSTGPGHIFKFQEAEILARDDNHVSRELLESWFSGPQSINKHNDLPVPYSVLRFSLGRRISHVGRARASNHHGDSEPVCRAIVTPASSTDDEIAAIYDSDSDRQATAASITTPAAIARTVNCSAHTVPRQPRAINTALLVPPSRLSANVSDDGFE